MTTLNKIGHIIQSSKIIRGRFYEEAILDVLSTQYEVHTDLKAWDFYLPELDLFIDSKSKGFNNNTPIPDFINKYRTSSQGLFLINNNVMTWPKRKIEEQGNFSVELADEFLSSLLGMKVDIESMVNDKYIKQVKAKGKEMLSSKEYKIFKELINE